MSHAIENAVKDTYGSVAASTLSGGQEGVRAVAAAFGYTPEQLAAIPAEANMGLSCGNPTAFASLRAGETVVDLGCGGGMDVFLAAPLVGPTGRAIGIDMTPAMIARARRNAAKAAAGGQGGNVEFHLARIDALPLADASVDCVISNCVINLAPDKAAVFREIVRVLKPGGRLAASDIALKQPLPPQIARDVMAYVGCIAGALPIQTYLGLLRDAGLAEVTAIDTGADLNAYAKVEGQAACCTPPAAPHGLRVLGSGCCSAETPGAGGADLHTRLAELLGRYNINDYAASIRVLGVKPAARPDESGGA